MTDEEKQASEEIYQFHVEAAMKESGFDLYCINRATDIHFKAFEEVFDAYGSALALCALEITSKTFVAAEKKYQEIHETEDKSNMEV